MVWVTEEDLVSEEDSVRVQVEAWGAVSARDGSAADGVEEILIAALHRGACGPTHQPDTTRHLMAARTVTLIGRPNTKKKFNRRLKMPGYDGTGPRGMGPMTGGGRGFCAVPLNSAGNRPYWGRGFRRYRAGQGFPVGRGSREDEIAMLKDQADILKQQLEDIEARLHEIESVQESGQQ